ncbi:MAG: 3-dehydroquinate synthase [Alphaproteobacteria bacterium]|nr:3-dehydroquinate synthase [Alphaproteobacteria bacterium]
MTEPAIIRVALPPEGTDRAYDITIGTGQIAQAGALAAARLGTRSCVVVTDSTVGAYYLKPLEASLRAAGHRLLEPVVIPPGEASKNFVQLEKILDALLARRIDRKTLLFALGGGVVGDIAGLAAALALRGIPFVQVPTTLLAQVDSAVGGKTAVDHRIGKNLIGAFYQPQMVVIDTETLKTLPARELRAGYAEVVKYGLINDAAFFGWCEKNGGKLLAGDSEAQVYAIKASCAAKAAVVAADEKEAGQRALLNLGHTFGHALEAATGFDATLLHGEAVALGCVLAFRLSADLGYCKSDVTARIAAHFAAQGLPIHPPKIQADAAQLVKLMEQDKKAEGGRLTLVLARGIGEAFVARDVDPAAVRNVWAGVLS